MIFDQSLLIGPPHQVAGSVWVVDSQYEVDRLYERMMSSEGEVWGCDSETRDINPKEESPAKGNGRIVVWSCAYFDERLGNHPTTGYPLAQRIFVKNWGEAEEKRWLYKFQEWFEDPKYKKVGASFFGFDRHVFWNHGINVQGICFDNVRASRLNDASQMEHGLKLQGIDLGYIMRDYGELFKRPKIKKDGTPGKEMILIPLLTVVQDPDWLNILIDYASLDAKVSLEAWPVMRDKLAKKEWRRDGTTMVDYYDKLQTPYYYVLNGAEREGWDLDEQWCSEQAEIATRDMDALARDLVAWTGVMMNFGSPKQLGHLLYATVPDTVVKANRNLIPGFGFKVPPVTKSKKRPKPWEEEDEDNPFRPTDAVALEYLADNARAKKDKKGLRTLLEWRKIKDVKKYLVGLPKFQDVKGRVHSNVAPDTETARLNAYKPALQQIPAPGKDPVRDRYMIREAFTCPPGFMLIGADFCLAEGTLIDTPKGSIPIENIRKGDLVFTYNRKTSKPDCSKVSSHKFTGTRVTLVVELDNGKRVRCTPEHRWLRADGSEVQAYQLQPGDRLLPLRKSYAGTQPYPTMYSRSNREYVYTHHVVKAADLGIEIGELYNTLHDMHVHHKDEDPNNFDPDNLEYKIAVKHWSDHATVATKVQWTKPAVREKMIDGIAESIQTKRGGYIGENNPNYGKLKGKELQCNGCNKIFYRPPCKAARFCSRKCYFAARFGDADLNHKVVAVHRDNICVQTFDIEVARDHNFALSAGVFVHNSQLEMRILAHYLIVLFQDHKLADDLTAADLHSATALRVFGRNEIQLQEHIARKFDNIRVIESWEQIAHYVDDEEKAQFFNDLPFIPHDTPVKLIKKFFGGFRNKGKIVNFCVSGDTTALTPDGWKTHEEIKPGMLVLGRNGWTTVREVHRYGDSELVDMWGFHVTPNHRWWAERRTTVNGSKRLYIEEFVESDKFTAEHRARLSVHQNFEDRSGLTPDEAALVAWIITDGHMAPNGTVSVFQKSEGKFAHIIDELMKNWPHSRYVRPTGIVQWRLRAPAAKRFKPIATGVDEQFVLALGSEQRRRFAEAGLQAEGCLRPYVRVDNTSQQSFAQNAGRIADAFRLAFFLEGWRVTQSESISYTGNKFLQMCLSSPYKTRQRKPLQTVGRGFSWCLTTDDGTFTVRRGDNICITGNSVNYGKTAWGLGFDLRDESGDPIGQDAAQLILNAYFEAYPAVLRFKNWSIGYATKRGFARSLLGRYRPLPLIWDQSRSIRGHEERKAQNTPIQMSAAEIAMMAELKTNTVDMPELRDAGFFDEELARMGVVHLMQIHDELIFKVPRAHATEACARVKMLMENPLDTPLTVPLPVEAKTGMTWQSVK